MAYHHAVFAFVVGLCARPTLYRVLNALKGLNFWNTASACANSRLLEDITQVTDEGELEVLPYSDFAACSLLGLRPSAQNVHRTTVYEALKCLSAAFLRANRSDVQTTLQHDYLQRVLITAGEPPAALIPTDLHDKNTQCMLAIRRMAAAAKHAVCKSSMDTCSNPTDVLLQELERLLFMYLSRNWDQVAALVDVNQDDLEVTCQKCNGSSPNALQSSRSTDSLWSSPSSINSVQSVNGLVHWGNSKPTDPHDRARYNWSRAQRVVRKYMATRRLGKPHRINGLMELLSTSHKCDAESPSDHQPVLLLLGGGMAAGKTTVRDLIGQSEFWSMVGNDAVVVEADAIKNQDKIYQDLKLNEFKHDLSIDEVVHEYFTRAAENMLVTAINMQRDVVFDGTHVWPPFIEQTIAMARDHQHTYKVGPGYRTVDGVTSELYWVPETKCDGHSPNLKHRKPYRVELVGVTCDPGLAVARGIWRKLRTGRGVPVRAQLRSHRLFSTNFERFASLVDSATLYHTGSALTMFNKWSMDVAPKIIAHSSSHTQREMLVNPTEWDRFTRLQRINDDATRVSELYGRKGDRNRCPLAQVSEREAVGIEKLRQLLRVEHQKELSASQVFLQAAEVADSLDVADWMQDND